MTARAGCPVTDDRPCPQHLAMDEHVLREGVWLHPVGLDRNGRWYWDEETT